LQTASLIAADLLSPEDKDDDGIPVVRPISYGREGPAPLVIRLPCLRDEVERLAELLAEEHDSGGRAWGDMAILCHDYTVMNACASALTRKRLPHQVRKRSGDYRPAQDAIKVMTMKVSKGLEFPIVAIPGVGSMPAPGADEKEEARLFYVAATRATEKLLLTISGDGAFGKKFDLVAG
jgi:superfamily I DNA/RNA helicase